MPLPAANTPWPPTQDLTRYATMKVNATWYEGDPMKLAGLYQGGTVESMPGGATQGVVQRVYTTVKRWFWGVETAEGERDTKIHVPIAQDIATMSSELLFAQSPVIKLDVPKIEREKAPPAPSPITGTLPPDPLTGEVPEVGAPPIDSATGEVATEVVDDPAGLEAQQTLEWLLDRIGLQSVLLAAAETQSPLGSTCLRIAWDKSIDAKAPFLTRVDADAAVPEYRWGKLVALTFWTVIYAKDNKVVRHLERYEAGKVLHGVYEGTHDNLGIVVPVTNYPETAWLAGDPANGIPSPLQNGNELVGVPEGTLLATSVPNKLPDPSDRQAAIGASDFSPGVLTLMDAVDEIATSLMRDIDLGKGRVFLARYMLEDKGAGKGAEFNTDQRYFSPLNLNPAEQEQMPLVASQFAIRVDEHLRSIEWYAAKAVRAAGYNPDADFGDDGGDMTATEYSGKNARSFSTRSKKILYWTTALQQIIEALIKIFNQEFAAAAGKTPIPEEFPIIVEFPPAARPDIKILAETASMMKSAEAASMEVRVQLLHPDWDDTQVNQEVEKIKEEAKASATIDPAAFGLAPTSGDDQTPPQITTPSPFEE
ncbi:portal protein [Microbacterium phage Johann]|uniref:Portal protein n=1 Tax=Microbacterium phage Johann TaxID=2484207 RepID=A0A3G3LZL9_9CAUD|nr:portal protein [Microbacterium phage Johann]